MASDLSIIKNPRQDIFTVSEINSITKRLLEESIGTIKVSGEISNLSRSAPGHLYWTLKDAKAQIRCAMFRGQAAKLKFDLDNGDEIIVTGKVTLYPAHGSYQIIAESLSEVGEGKLRKQYELLKEKLEKEGLFDEKNKKIIPLYPKQIGIITSPTSAAVRDIIATIKRRFPSIPIIIYPTQVQGSDAPNQIRNMLLKADTHGICDVIILARGGGSLEDLWAFNDEQLARAILKCNTPIVCGVGHENDFTIADFVADLRAATPTAAAEHVTPNQVELNHQITAYKKQLINYILQKINLSKHELLLQKSLLIKLHPLQKLQSYAQNIDFLALRIGELTRKKINSTKEQISYLTRMLSPRKIKFIFDANNKQLIFFSKKLNLSILRLVQIKQSQFQSLCRHLDLQSPLKVIDKGYSITKKEGSHYSIKTTKDISIGENLITQLRDGEIISAVSKIKKLL